ncbi:PQQ-dependent sugar dehydrogenase [Candidatus Nitrospira nitrificans]|uniref:Putative glucose/sorbosone dehydrogenase n=1 Tax=Candidatus Nitrospira nitrificans TaxID=1742973 RepID=A0A0S4LSI2_9BACT|nr:PQQ-dependent sugar dehydrogenase [Candidatus Nitrospira nitrificans]CUS39918.1 putative glucose/sorbosone dehydrogenase [Candidatus Nitrospira nitrificans]
MRQAIICMTLCLCFAGLLAACGNDNTTGNVAPTSTSLKLQTVASNLSSPVFLATSPGDQTRLFVVEQGGTIKVVDRAAGTVLATFLSLSGISSGGEQGLLGLAFDPNYTANGRFYVHYTDANGAITIARFLRSSTNPNVADPASQVILVSIPHPTFANHNGGMLAFGPDGCLYAAVGDGGSAGDPNNNAQNLASRLGKLLRIDPTTPGTACTSGTLNPFVLSGGDQLVWSYGLRNPWRFSFDGADLYIGDVGQEAREEITVSQGPHAGRGLNYGWRLMEGSACFNPSTDCNNGGLTLPVFEYPHENGACSVTGGYVYRGTAIPVIQGAYFYADFCAGFVRSFRFNNGSALDQTEWPLLTVSSITSFGQDGLGELYILTRNGTVSRIVPN